MVPHEAGGTEPHALARRAAQAGSEVALDAFRSAFAVNTKDGPMDAVTQADLDTQARVVSLLEAAAPAAAIVGEEAEAADTVPETGPAWVIDPIDGTNNFARGNRLWATSVAAVEDGSPRAATNVLPALGDEVSVEDGQTTLNGAAVEVSDRSDPGEMIVAPIFGLGKRDRDEFAATSEGLLRTFGDLRRLGSGQSTLAMIACGEIDGAVSTLRHAPWDTIAGAHLVRRAGGMITDIDGDEWRHDSSSLVASNGHAHETLCETARRAIERMGDDWTDRG